MPIRISEEFYIGALEKLEYDETSPSCLRWKETGQVAGSQDPKGYWLVRVNYKLLKAHRIIWYMYTNTLPDLIDHRNNDPSQNRIGNLRDATESQNRANTKTHSDNKSGAKGITWDPVNKAWQARCCVNYKTHHAGRFKDKDEAIAAVTALRTKLHMEFARHA